MHEVQERLAQRKSNAITQHVQRQVVDDLQSLIDETKKSSKNGGSMKMANMPKASSKPGGSPNAQPKSNTANDRPSGDSDPNAKHEPKQPPTERTATAVNTMKQQYKLELQEHEREQMLELPSEYFLPDYEREIEDYFRRLSSGKPTEDKPAEDRPPEDKQTVERP